MKPCIGQRVRRTAPHKEIPIGMLGTIDVVHEDGQDFWVVTDGMPDCGAGFCGWTTFEQWMPVAKEGDEHEASIE